jgi:hypothetical protein
MNRLPFQSPNTALPARWFPVKNDDATAAPPNGVGKVVDTDANGVIHVVRPDADSIDPRRLVILDGNGAAAGGYCQATDQWPWWAATDASPAVGDELGTAAGSWKLAATKTGFVAWSAAASGMFLADAGGGGLTTCPPPPDPPEGVACTDCCHKDDIEEMCDGTGTGSVFRLVKTFLLGNGKFRECVGPWTADYPPPDWDPC